MIFKTSGMRFAVVARDENNQYTIEKQVKKRGHVVVKKNPEMVISFGGDGTLLIAERKFPGVPKLQCKDSEHCNTCPGYDSPLDELIARVENKDYEMKKHFKLDATIIHKGKKGQTFTCANDFSIRNQLIIQALRFEVKIGEEVALADELIGDGVVVATSFGSSGYYHSITKKSFEEGIGIALNNCTIPQRGIHTTRDKSVTITITRMYADFAIDNDTTIHTLSPGDQVVITASAEQLQIIDFSKK